MMAIYTEPPAVVTGQTMTATNWNAWVRTNFQAVWAWTTAGDMNYASAANQLSRLGIGASGSLLRSTGSAPAWLAPGSAGQQLGISGGVPAWLDGVPGIFTAAGDLVYGSGADAAARLAIGATGAILRSTGSAPAWLAPGSAGQQLGISGGVPAWLDGVPGIFAAAGDLVYGSGADAAARLAIGANGAILRSTGSAPAWLVKGSANQVLGVNAGGTDLEWKSTLAQGTRVVNSSYNLSSGSYTEVSFTAESIDQLGAWVVGSPTRLTIPTTGWYMVSAYMSFGNNSSGIRFTAITLNGTINVITTDQRMPVSGAPTNVSLACLAYLTAADYLQFQHYQNSGSTLTVTTSVVTLARL